MIKDSDKPMSPEESREFREAAEKRSQRKVIKLEARHMIIQARRAGLMDVSMKTEPLGFLDPLWAAQKGLNTVEISTKMFQTPECWAKHGSYILIDGGDAETRSIVAGIFVFRGMLLHAAASDSVAKMVRFAEIMPILSTFSYDRIRLVERMRAYRLLCLAEFDPASAPRDASEGGKVVDAILVSRAAAYLPTILTVSVPADWQENGKNKSFPDPAAFGRTFESLLQSPHNEAKGIWKIRLKTNAEA